MEIKKILVTGSSGTIGTRLCELLLSMGYDVIGADWKKNKWNKAVDDITINIDLRSYQDVVENLPKDVDAVVHLAANPRVYNLVVDPKLARDNFLTVFNVLEYARQNNINKFMFSSSREVYGNSEIIKHVEDDADIRRCESPYTATKFAGEALIRAYQQCYNMDFIIFRFSNVYGMYDESDRLIPLYIKYCMQGKDLIVFGEDKLLDFTYIDDTVNGVLLCIKNFNKNKNEVYNIAYGEGTTILDVAKKVKEYLNSKNKIIIKENRTGEVVKFFADIMKANSNFGYKPKTNVFKGIEKAIEWYKDNLYT